MTKEQIERIAQAVSLFEKLPENERWRIIGAMEAITTRAELDRLDAQIQGLRPAVTCNV